MRKRFGEFEFDLETRQLRRDRETIPLSPKAFALLELLLVRAPAAVSKDQILGLVWKGTAASDGSLTNVVTELRAALGERPREARFIRTVHGFGYAFAGDVATASRGEPAATWRLVVAAFPYALQTGVSVIGRDPDVTVHIDHSSVSRRHARVSIQGDSAIVEDLDSRNGTFVNGQRVESPTALHDGDVLGLGPVAAMVERRGAAASTETNLNR